MSNLETDTVIKTSKINIRYIANMISKPRKSDFHFKMNGKFGYEHHNTHCDYEYPSSVTDDPAHML